MLILIGAQKYKDTRIGTKYVGIILWNKGSEWRLMAVIYLCCMFEHWLHPVTLPDQPWSSTQLGGHIDRHTEHALPDLKKAKVAILGLGEGINAIRQHLYKMYWPWPQSNVADLGEVKKDDPDFVLPLIRELLEAGILPILLSESDLHAGIQFLAYPSKQQLINMVVVDQELANPDEHYALQFSKEKSSRLLQLGLLGYQSHLTSPVWLTHFYKRHYDLLRLGKLRSDMEEAEPMIRDADLLCFHTSALRMAEAPAQARPGPSGLIAEEACQIARYAGMSDKLSSLGIYGFNPGHPDREQTNMVIAQMVWYFLDGFYNRKMDMPGKYQGLLEYIVDYKTTDIRLTFLKSPRSGRWWLRIPFSKKPEQERHALVPCSYKDYQLACQDQLPDRLMYALQRLK